MRDGAPGEVAFPPALVRCCRGARTAARSRPGYLRRLFPPDGLSLMAVLSGLFRPTRRGHSAVRLRPADRPHIVRRPSTAPAAAARPAYRPGAGDGARKCARHLPRPSGPISRGRPVFLRAVWRYLGADLLHAVPRRLSRLGPVRCLWDNARLSSARNETVMRVDGGPGYSLLVRADI